MYIDMHMHIAMDSDLGWTPSTVGPPSPEQYIEAYDKAGIDKGVMLPLVIPECNMLTQSNEDILMIYQKYPDRFIPFCNIDPRLYRNRATNDFGFIIEHYKEMGCRGIGEMTANLYWDDPRVMNLLKCAEKADIPCTFHVAHREGNIYGLIDDFQLPRFEKACQAFPNLTFFAHSQSWWAYMSGDVTEEQWGGYPAGPVTPGGRVPELMRKYRNIVGDMSAGSGFNAISRDPEFGFAFMEEFQDQLVFATDICRPENFDNMLWSLKNYLEKALEDGNISRGVYEKITHTNAERLLKL